ncbi:hypothetical protein F511_43302 [Dorcoceras hygrometricum]|uniref:Uncharacterized protein n=1 Tax=Dorcoceras hygrometricum TaxID=472368 RepID=A0A2Z7AUT0_9LAMI|nr:hypothetical protein F511_43302 [Dorcoceras hygrometricum]
MGIDQLNLHSVQLGYLKTLQMGNTDPNNTKAGKEIRGQASVRRAIKQLIMQHAKIDAMKCMRAIKGRIARPVSQLAIISVEPLYHARCINRRNHRSVIFRAHQPITARWYSDTTNQSHHSDDSVGLFRHNTSVGQSQHGSKSGHQSICKSGSRCMHISPGTANLKPSHTGHGNSARRTLTQKLTLTKERSGKIRAGSSRFLNSTVLVSKLVSINKATQGEFSATNYNQNNGWRRRKSMEKTTVNSS